MKSPFFSCFVILAGAFALSACSNSLDRAEKIVQDEDSKEGIYATESDPAKTLSEEQTENRQKSDNVIPFDSRRFGGDIEDIFYAEDSHILVYADKFQLYDTAADTMTGEFSVNEGRVQERAFFSLSGGYALVGALYGAEFNSSLSSDVRALKCWYFDKDFVCRQTIDLSGVVIEGGDCFAFSAAVSEDGEKIGIAGNDALYVYDVASGRLTPLFRYNETGYADDMMVSELGFAEHGEKLVFTGSALMADSTENVPLYGMVSTEGSGLACYTSSEYELSDEMILFENEIWFPEAFDKAAGKLLITDTNGKTIRIVDLEGEDTGADGIFASDNGKYIATIQWISEKSCWRVRIYDAIDGNIVHEQMIEIDEERYSSIVCKVHILEERNECIVVAGRGRQTFISSFFF